MNRRMLGRVLLAAGVISTFLGVAADAVGIGTSPGLGALQTAMLVVGIVLILVGALQLRAGDRPPGTPAG